MLFVDDDCVAEVENSCRVYVTPQVKIQRCVRIGRLFSEETELFPAKTKGSYTKQQKFM